MTDDVLDFLRERFARVDKQFDDIRIELANMRDAIDVLTAMSIRHESSIQSVVHELQTIHRASARTNDRLRKLEETAK